MIGFERGGLAPRRGGLTSTAPRGAAAGAAVNRSHHTTDEPYTTHPHAPEAQKRGVRPPRFSSASRSRDERGRGAHRFESNKATTMARSMGASMARGLGILLIMMTLSEIAATRARPAYHNKGLLPPPIHPDDARRPPFKTRAGRRRRAAATTGTSGGSVARRCADAPPHLNETRRLRI